MDTNTERTELLSGKSKPHTEDCEISKGKQIYTVMYISSKLAIFLFHDLPTCTGNRKERIWLVISLIIFPAFLFAFIIFIAVSVSKYKFCGNVHASSADHQYTRSGSVSLLKTITESDLVCYKPIINAQLRGEASVTIYETPCGDLHTAKFHIDRKSLTYENVIQPMVALSEDFSDNYFLKGSIDLVINATFNASSGADIYICLFVDYKVFIDFTNSDKDWRMYTKNATCRRTSERQSKITFDVTNPNYVFIAIATTEVLDTLQFGYNGTRYNYDTPTFANLTQLCSLRSDKPSSSRCSSSISNTGDDLCILVSNEVNADSSYYYSTIALNFPSVTRRTGDGIALTVAAFVCFIVMVLSFVLICILAIRLRKS